MHLFRRISLKITLTFDKTGTNIKTEQKLLMWQQKWTRFTMSLPEQAVTGRGARARVWRMSGSSGRQGVARGDPRARGQAVVMPSPGFPRDDPRSVGTAGKNEDIKRV